MLQRGDPAPWFETASLLNPRFNFDSIAGRYVLLTFLGSALATPAMKFLRDMEARREQFDVSKVVFCGVTCDPEDWKLLSSQPASNGVLFFADFNRSIARGYGIMEDHIEEVRFPPTTLVLDEGLRVLEVFPISGDGSRHLEQVMRFVDTLPVIASIKRTAPVLMLDRIFEVSVCRRLIDYFEAIGGRDSGFMRDIAGKTTGFIDHNFKRRSDCEITDSDLICELHLRISRRVIPEIRKAFNFQATRIERHIIACYDGANGGHFRPHRDNTTAGTAHRRFAVSINLNAEDFEGGNLRFPEFGPRPYRPSTGGAVVFSCSLLHEVMPVTVGKRYAFLPFVYDDAAAQIREHNREQLSGASVPTIRENANV